MTTPTVTERGRLIALRAAWLFDGTGSALIPDPLVVIDGGTIVAVDSGAAAPEGADLVDLGRATLLPGLVDTHVHLAFDASADPVGALAGLSGEQATEAMARAGRDRSPVPPARAARGRRRRLRPGRRPEHQDRVRHRGHRRGARRDGARADRPVGFGR